jgi:hypothetical protein
VSNAGSGGARAGLTEAALSTAGILHHSMHQRQIKAEFQHHVGVGMSCMRRRRDSSSGVDSFTKQYCKISGCDFLAGRGRIYGAERRWAGLPFWQRRQNA